MSETHSESKKKRTNSSTLHATGQLVIEIIVLKRKYRCTNDLLIASFVFNIFQSRKREREREREKVKCTTFVSIYWLWLSVITILWFLLSFNQSQDIQYTCVQVMMLLLFHLLFIYISFLVKCSSSERCPLVDYCTCSSDLTIVKCNNRQLTNAHLIQVNRQLTNSTIFLNLSSNSFTSIRSLPNLPSLQILDLSFNPIRYLSPIIFTKFPRLISLHLRNLSVKILPKLFKNHSTIHFNLSNTSPQRPIILHENDRLILNCSSPSAHYWTQNQHIFPPTIIASSYSIIFIDHFHVKHSGIWTCQNSHSNHSISLTVLTNASNSFCQAVQMNTSKGYFSWPRTSLNQRIELQCPHGSAAWLGDGNQYARASYTCASNGQWMNFDMSQCGYRTNISRNFDRLSLNDKQFLVYLVKYLAEINRNEILFDDILLLIDFVDEQQRKSHHPDRMMLIYHLVDLILQIQYPLSNSWKNQQAMNRFEKDQFWLT